jgi:hypothetical protein
MYQGAHREQHLEQRKNEECEGSHLSYIFAEEASVGVLWLLWSSLVYSMQKRDHVGQTTSKQMK